MPSAKTAPVSDSQAPPSRRRSVSPDDLALILASLRYHDLGKLLRIPGIGMTWVTPDGDHHAAGVTAKPRSRSGATGHVGSYPADLAEHPRLALSYVLSGGDDDDDDSQVSLPDERMLWGTLFPAPDAPAVPETFRLDIVEHPAPAILYAFQDGHRALAREALATMSIPRAMRDALLSGMNHGHGTLPYRCGGRYRSVEKFGWDTIEFVAVHPALAEVLAERPVLDRIQNGAHPAEALARFAPGLTPAHLRRLAGKGFSLSGDMPKRGLSRLDTDALVLSSLRSIPPDWMPSGAGWDVFAPVAVMAMNLRSTCGLDPAILLGASRGDWPAYMGRSMRAIDMTPAATSRPPTFGAAIRTVTAADDAKDPANALRDQLLVPVILHLGLMPEEVTTARHERPNEGAAAARHDRLIHEAGRILYGGKSLPAVLRLSHLWHARADAMRTRIATITTDQSWPALLPDTTHPVDITVTCITDAASLADEGAKGHDRNGVLGLDHCVAGRLPGCRSGKAHILSVRRTYADGSHVRLSTCELRIDATGLPRVAEHRGYRNGKPAEDVERAIATVIAQVRAGQLAMSDEAKSLRDIPAVTARDRCQYDWEDPAQVMAAAEAWGPMLPRWSRASSPRALFEAWKAHGLSLAPQPTRGSDPIGWYGAYGLALADA